MKIMRAVVGGFPRLHEDISKAIEMSIELQLRNGIEILCDGDQRCDMISYYATGIPGLGIENGHPIVTGKVTPPDDLMALRKVSDFLMLQEKHPDLKFKVPIAGPTTLAMSCGSKRIRDGYRNYADFSLAADLAEALRGVVGVLSKAGALIQVDEPFFSQGFRDLDARIDLVDDLLEGCRSELCSMHVCGYLGRQPLLQKMAEMENIGIFSHAFSIARDRERENLALIGKGVFGDTGKKLAAGILSVSPRTMDEIEAPKTVSDRLADIVERIGLENIAYVTPDCYLRAVNVELVEPLLRRLDEGTSAYEQSIG